MAERDAATRAAQIELAAEAAAALVLKQLGSSSSGSSSSSSSSSSSRSKQQLDGEQVEDGTDASPAAPTGGTSTHSTPATMDAKDAVIVGKGVTDREKQGEGEAEGEIGGRRGGEEGGEIGERVRENGESKLPPAVHTPKIAFDLPPRSPEIDDSRGRLTDAPPPSEERPHASSSSLTTLTNTSATATSSLPNPRPSRPFTGATPDRLRAVAAQLVPLSMSQTGTGVPYGGQSHGTNKNGHALSSAVGLKRPIGYVPSPPSMAEVEGIPSEVEFLDASFSGQKYTGLLLLPKPLPSLFHLSFVSRLSLMNTTATHPF